jgi:DNA-binding NtrC family response regulator
MMQCRPLHVLIVDDSEADLRTTRDLLARAAETTFTVQCAMSYDEGLSAVTDGHVDVCLVDYNLAGRDGMDFVRDAGRRGATAAMILLSGYEPLAHADEVYAAEAADALPK